MRRALLLSVRFQDGRYHGHPEWPPSPARLFQALLAGAARGRQLAADDQSALAWLETLAPPVIAAPAIRPGRGFVNYVPNNDLDSVGGDPGRISEIRAGKLIKPFLFDGAATLLYAWEFEESEAQATKICGIAERLYQLGRGVDMAWALAEIVDASEVERKLAAHGGQVHRPVGGQAETTLLCPQKGSLGSLEERFERAGKRFASAGKGKRSQQHLFSQAPKPLFRTVVYDSPPQRFLFDLRQVTGELGFSPRPIAHASRLVESLRDEAAKRLQGALPSRSAWIERALIGRGASEADKAARIRIVPLPSIGSSHVIPSIRRVLVEIPGNCPLPLEDVRQAFSGLQALERIDPQTGEILEEVRLIPAEDNGMLEHYGIADRRHDGRLWRTVTPVVLPERAARRRIDPIKLRAERDAARQNKTTESKEAKGSRERLDEERRAAGAVVHALRHAGISAPVEAIRVQREPFEGRGARAELFAEGTRFAKERLWHVEIAFGEAIRGPVVIGDGRYLGLGLMAPVKDAWPDTLTLAVPREAGIQASDGPALVQAARRALMALSRDRDGTVPRLFSGHEPNGARAASGQHEHIFLVADDGNKDGLIDRLIIAAPWACDRVIKPKRSVRKLFDAVVSRLQTLRAGKLGVIALGRPSPLASDDPLIGPSRAWESSTPYRATRHAGRRKDLQTALIHDLTMECHRRGLPRPEIKLLSHSTLPNGGGLVARAELYFAAAVHGPLLLGRDSHQGGGLFVGRCRT
ncbi:MAG: type I-U CRISPR-associated protein Csb2 [Parvibaculaceae bacterium]